MGAAVEPDHDELAAFAQDVDAELHRLWRADEIDRRGGPTTSRLHYLLHHIGRGVVDRRDGAHLARMRALLRVDIGDDHLAGDRGRCDVHGAAADTAGADDHEMVVAADMVTRLLQRRIGGDAGAGVGRGERLRDAVIRQEIAAVWHEDMRAVAAGDPGAEGARPQAQQFLALRLGIGIFPCFERLAPFDDLHRPHFAFPLGHKQFVAVSPSPSHA